MLVRYHRAGGVVLSAVKTQPGTSGSTARLSMENGSSQTGWSVARSEYYRLRHRFIQDVQECVETLTLAHTYAKIIEVKPVDWLVLWIIFGVVNIRYELLPPMLVKLDQEDATAATPLMDHNDVHFFPLFPQSFTPCRFTKILLSKLERRRRSRTNCMSLIEFLGDPKYQRRSSIHIAQTQNRQIGSSSMASLLTYSAAISGFCTSHHQRLNRHHVDFQTCLRRSADVPVTSAIVLVWITWTQRDGPCLQVAIVRISRKRSWFEVVSPCHALTMLEKVEVIKHQKFEKQRKVMQMLSSLQVILVISRSVPMTSLVQFFIDKAEAFTSERSHDEMLHVPSDVEYFNSAAAGAAEGSAAQTLFKADEVKSR
eukprot:65086-Hanusia_phi.AAC.3